MDESTTDSGNIDVVLPGRVGRMVRLIARPGMRPALLDLVHRYTDQLTTDEPGTEMFVVNVDPDQSEVVWLFEWFDGPEGEVAHRSSPAFAAFTSEMPSVLAGPPAVVALEPLRMHMTNSVISQDFNLDQL